MLTYFFLLHSARDNTWKVKELSFLKKNATYIVYLISFTVLSHDVDVQLLIFSSFGRVEFNFRIDVSP